MPTQSSTNLYPWRLRLSREKFREFQWPKISFRNHHLRQPSLAVRVGVKVLEEDSSVVTLEGEAEGVTQQPLDPDHMCRW